MLVYAGFLVSTSFNLLITVVCKFLVKPESKQNPGSSYIVWILCTSIWYLLTIRGIIEKAFYLTLNDEKLILIFWHKSPNYTAFILLIAALLLIYSYVPSDIKKKN